MVWNMWSSLESSDGVNSLVYKVDTLKLEVLTKNTLDYVIQSPVK